ncbi:L,D-transpeptidase [Pannonibacter phragmitetus]|uniref:L,D-transpeptidase n=1 Tax=Pannonibacter phragmitetus TaxID=121719 RepID=UPI003D2F13E7
MLLSRRRFLVAASATLLAGCNSRYVQPVPSPGMARDGYEGAAPSYSQIPAEYLQMYGPMPNEQFPIPAADLRRVKPQFFRQIVPYQSPEPTGTIIVDTPNRYLYLTMEGGQAMRYGVGIGRAGFTWGGAARIAYKREWPKWTPPSEMIARQPELEQYRNGMEPGLANPLGARALYIFEGGRDTLYRIHGTAEYWTIGTAVSSGCVRMINQDVIDLYNRVPNGTKIVVIQAPESAPVAGGAQQGFALPS